MLTPPELVWLLASVANGDEEAFARLYATTRAKLYGVVLRILRREGLAQEVLQETYLTVWQSAGKFDPLRATPITWLVAIARNRAIDLLRRQSEASIEEEPDAVGAASGNPTSPERPEFSDELQCLLACIGRLPQERQRLVLLAYYNGWSRNRLAAELQTPVDTIKTWVRDSVAGIRECLDHG